MLLSVLQFVRFIPLSSFQHTNFPKETVKHEKWMSQPAFTFISDMHLTLQANTSKNVYRTWIVFNLFSFAFQIVFAIAQQMQQNRDALKQFFIFYLFIFFSQVLWSYSAGIKVENPSARFSLGLYPSHWTRRNLAWQTEFRATNCGRCLSRSAPARCSKTH